MKWEIKPVSELCFLAIDCVNKTAPLSENITEYKMLRTTNVKGGFIDFESVRYVEEDVFKKWVRRAQPQYGDVLFTREAPAGEVGRFTAKTGNYFLGQRLFLYRTDPAKLDWNYLAYVLQSPQIQGWVQGAAYGATVPHLAVSDMEHLKIPAPPVPIQKKIGDILSRYDDLIENNLKRIKLLEEMARITYEEWFVRLRFPGYESTLVNAESGLPEGWDLLYFEDLIDFKEGPGLRNWQYREEGIPFLNIRVIKDGDVDLQKTQYLDPDEVASKYPHFLLQENDHVISTSGTLGRLATIRKCHLPLCLNTSIIRMREKDKRFGKWQIKHMLLSSFFQNKLETYANGAAQANFGPLHLKQIKLVTAPENLALIYEEIASPAEEAIKNLRDYNQHLREARNILLPRLMTGVIDVESYNPKQLLKEAI
jgi:type I restriction enzyme S subunit